MKNYLFFSVLLLILSCTNNKGVYWCGDHPCINNKEKEAYFKKTMIVEIKESKKESYKNNSEIDKLLQQARVDEKERIMSEKELLKKAKLDKKRRIKDEKELLKEAKLDEKRRIKDEKELVRDIEIEEQKRSEVKKITVDQNKLPDKNLELDTNIGNIITNLNEFDELVEKITTRNNLRPFPEIIDMPN